MQSAAALDSKLCGEIIFTLRNFLMRSDTRSLVSVFQKNVLRSFRTFKQSDSKSLVRIEFSRPDTNHLDEIGCRFGSGSRGPDPLFQPVKPTSTGFLFSRENRPGTKHRMGLCTSGAHSLSTHPRRKSAQKGVK